MTRKAYTTALALYRSRTFSLEEAAAYSGVSEAKVTVSLRSHGITVREETTSGTAEAAEINGQK